MNKIEVKHLAKRFKFAKKPLLNEVNFNLEENEIMDCSVKTEPGNQR